MHIHILGICGTFMAGVAEIAGQLGHRVTGSDANVYPPMSTFLRERGITLYEGYDREQFEPRPDLVLIGNALSRGNIAVEFVLDEHLSYSSGAQWLAEAALKDRQVIAVAGTHGKTTTTSLLTWILQAAGLEPGYLIGGIARNFARPANLGRGELFVIEADEYDTAFFDKRSKFLHYRPDCAIINNLEFDHADIFPDLRAIQTQFHHLMRTIPGAGSVIYPAGDAAIGEVLDRGCWSRRVSFGFDDSCDWRISNFDESREEKFRLHTGTGRGQGIRSKLLGRHNALNVTAAIAAAAEFGVGCAAADAALANFQGVKRRLEIIAQINGITLYDDFAHHPTAIAATIAALRGAVGAQRILCVLEPRSNTMRLDVHAAQIAAALADADEIFLFNAGDLQWDPARVLETLATPSACFDNIDDMIAAIARSARPHDHVVVMSNGGFGGIHGRLHESLAMN